MPFVFDTISRMDTFGSYSFLFLDGVISILFFYLLVILFKNTKKIPRILIVLEASFAIFICLISLSMAFNPWGNKTYLKQIGNLYFYRSEQIPDPGYFIKIYEKEGLLQAYRLTYHLNINDPDHCDILERNDSIFIHNTEKQRLYYLQQSLSDNWKVIELK